MQDPSSLAEEGLKEQLEKWKYEQLHIASQVLKIDDEIISERTNDSNIYACPKPPCTDKVLYGGVDVSFPENESHQSVATYVILDPITDTTVYKDFLYFDLKIPYVSSFLSFREIEPLEFLVKKQIRESPSLTPFAILVDGNGILHQRRAGIACFLGVRTGLPTIGVAKTLYCEGGLQKEMVQDGIDNILLELKSIHSEMKNPTERKETYAIIPTTPIVANEKLPIKRNVDRTKMIKDLDPLCCGIGIMLKVNSDEVLGAALLGHGGGVGTKREKEKGVRTKNPIYISIGHKISLQKALILCAQLSKSRIPEPVRQADLWGRELLRNKK